MPHVLAIEPLSSLTTEERRLLHLLFEDSEGDWEPADLLVYVLQTLVRSEEIDHLALTPMDVHSMEAPVKTIAPRNDAIGVGGFTQNCSGFEWTRKVVRVAHERSYIDERGHRVAPINTVSLLSLAPALSVTDEDGEPI